MKIRTRQETVKANHPKSKCFVIGLDAGYSSMKVFFENGHFCFPSFIKKKPKNMFGFPNEKDILYEDLETGEEYFVGYTAQKMVDSNSTNDTEGELFSRKRYSNKSFKILCNVAIGMALRDKKDNREIVIQTGLPVSYVEGDTASLIKTVAKPSKFSLKFGSSPKRNFEVAVKSENIYVMPQPAGSLYSVVMKKDGNYSDDAANILGANTIVVDPGFGTLDFFGIKSNEVCHKGTVDNLGMREVLTRVSAEILKKYGEDIKVPALQEHLETFKITCINEDEWKSTEYSIKEIVEQAVKDVCLEAMIKLRSETSAFAKYKYLIVGGGTGDAWFDQIYQMLKDFTFEGIYKANRHDPNIALLYANARGYYLFRRALNQHY